RLGNVFSRLGSEGLELFGLLNGGLETLAEESGLQLDDLGEGAGVEQRLDVRETGFRIGAQRSDGLQGDGAASGLGGLERGLEGLLGFLGAGLDLRIDFLRLLDALLGEGAELVGSLRS